MPDCSENTGHFVGAAVSFGFLEQPLPTPACFGEQVFGGYCSDRSWECVVGLPEGAGKWMGRLSGFLASQPASKSENVYPLGIKTFSLLDR